MKLQGSFGVSRRSDGVITITVRDEESSTEFLTIQCTPEDFANGLTGRHGTPCLLDVNRVDRLGKTLETKEVYLEAPAADYLYTSWKRLPMSIMDKILAEHEVDGWRVETQGSWNNMHKRFKDGYLAIARRWV